MRHNNNKVSFKLISGVAIITLIIMIVYESCKQYLFPEISIWESHAITILFCTVVETALAFWVFRIRGRLAIQSEKKLKESEKRYRLIVDNVNDALYVINFKGTILDVNDNGCRLIGYTCEELLGSSILKVNAPESRAFIRQQIDHIKKEKN